VSREGSEECDQNWEEPRLKATTHTTTISLAIENCDSFTASLPWTIAIS
jgi:hypothetical protein